MRAYLQALIILSLVLEAPPAFPLANGWPVPCGSVTSTIGWRSDPFGSGRLKWHNGTDIAVPLHTPVTPTGSGLVRFAGWHKDYGWLVVVDHHNGWFSMYGHNEALAVQAGEEVTAETVIAYAGSTGRSTGVHVHYEVRWFPEGAKKAAAAERRVSEKGPEVPVEEGFKGYLETVPGGMGGE